VPVSTQPLEQAFQIANRHGRSFYGSLYVAAAVSQQATLITADEKLASANGWAGFERAKPPSSNQNQ
jgi:predicted nucleic acid-binding protein